MARKKTDFCRTKLQCGSCKKVKTYSWEKEYKEALEHGKCAKCRDKEKVARTCPTCQQIVYGTRKNARLADGNNCAKCASAIVSSKLSNNDRIGKRFGQLVVVDRNRMWWTCKCDCGRIERIHQSSLDHYAESDYVACCKSCKLERTISAIRQRIYNAKQEDATKRGLPFSLTINQFCKIVEQSCTYCGVPPRASDAHCKQQWYKKWRDKHTTNGIDRINNAIGYIDGNCVPCCKRCNVAKHTKSAREFVALVSKISPRESIQCNYRIDEIALNRYYNRGYLIPAQNRNLEFTLDLACFKTLVTSTCHYCGAEPRRLADHVLKRMPLNGIDRVDNTIGYTKSNCVTCCSSCNFLKHNMNIDEFLAWVKRVQEYQKVTIEQNSAKSSNRHDANAKRTPS